jgi:SnoaL-like domain
MTTGAPQGPTTQDPDRPAQGLHGDRTDPAQSSLTNGREAGREIGIDAVPGMLACQDLIIDSYERADAGHRRGMAELFEQDGSLTLDDAAVTGRETIREVLAARDADPDRRTMHVVANLKFDQLAEARIQVRYALIVFVLSVSGSGAFVPNSLASVQDVLVRRGDRWRLHSRTITTALRER